MLAFFDLNKHDYNNPTETEEVYKAFCKIEDAIEFDEVLSKLFIDAKYKLEKEKKQFTLEELYNEFFRQINFTLNTVNMYSFLLLFVAILMMDYKERTSLG